MYAQWDLGTSVGVQYTPLPLCRCVFNYVQRFRGFNDSYLLLKLLQNCNPLQPDLHLAETREKK